MATKKKGFGAAADAFLGVQLPNQDTPAEVAEVKPAEVKVEPVPVETVAAAKPGKELKSKSVLLKLTPSLHEKIRLAAQEEGLAFNTYVTTLLVKSIK